MLIQEAIFPSDCVFKAYSVFGKYFIAINNQIDFQNKEMVAFEKSQVKKKVEREITEMEKTVGLFFTEELNSRKFLNYGLDFVCRSGTNDFYFFDLNPDNFHWTKAVKKDSPKTLRKGLASLVL